MTYNIQRSDSKSFYTQKWHSSSFAMWTGTNTWYIPWNSGSFSRVGKSLRIWELTAWKSYNLEVGGPEPHPLIIMHQVAFNLSSNCQILIAKQYDWKFPNLGNLLVFKLNQWHMLEEFISLEVCGLWTSGFEENAFYLRSLHSTSGQVRQKNATT